MIEFLPTVYSTAITGGIDGPKGDYGILKELDTLLQDKEAKSSSPQIENETKQRLDQMQLVEYPITDPEPEYELKRPPASNWASYEPIVFDALSENPIVNNTSILDFILNQPLNYWILTRYEDKLTWTQATLRPTVVFPKFNPWRWEYVDVDDNQSNGNEIRVRFDIVLDTDPETWYYDRPTLLPPTPGSLSIRGGISLTIERQTDNRTFPLEVFIAKSISYEGQNYIWNTGVKFDNTPEDYSAQLLAETVTLSGFTELLFNFSSLLNLANRTLAEINGPYSLIYSMNTENRIQDLDLMIGLVRYENLSLTDKNWLVFDVTPPSNGKFDHVPYSGEVWIDSSNVQAPIDRLKWTAGVADSENNSQDKSDIPSDLSIRYCEVRDHLIFANVELINLPEWFSIEIDYTKVVSGQNVTVLDYSAGDILGILDYTSYIYPNFIFGSAQFNCTHVLIEDVPMEYHMEITTDIGRDINTTPYHNPATGIVANLIDNLVVRFANRFYRIGKYLKLAAEGILDLPDKEGWALVDVKDSRFSNLEFYQTSNEYIDVPGNFVAFYNTTGSTGSSTPPGSTSNSASAFAISGRITNLGWANLSFSQPMEIELRVDSDDGLQAMFIDGDDYVLASISNIPSYLKLMNHENQSYYSTIDPEVPDDLDGTIINQFEFTSRIGQQFMQIQMKSLPEELSFSRKSGIISFSTHSDNYIGELNFQITSSISEPIYKLENGDYLSVVHEGDFITGSGKLSGIKNLTYDSNENGYFELELDDERAFHVVIISQEPSYTKAKVIIDPLPAQFQLELPGIIKKSNVDFPDLINQTGLLDFSELVFTLGKLGNEVVNLLGNLTEELINSIGNIGFDFSINYELESFGTSMDMIAEIERSGIPLSSPNTKDIYETATDDVLGGPIGWTHGVVMQQDTYSGEDILRGHLYLQGMPRSASLSTYFTENRTKVDFAFSEYNPKYDWLLIDLHGIQTRDVVVFFQKIPVNINLYASADLTTNLEIGGEMLGDIKIEITEANGGVCSEKIGALYVSMHTYEPIQSIREFMISELPARLNIDFQIQKEIQLLYDASKEIEFIYSKLSKILTDSWHHVHLILHDLPKWFKFNLFTNTDFNIDDPLPLQGLPRLLIETGETNTLDIKIQLDGAAVGQRGNIDILIQDVQETTADFRGGSYEIESTGLEFIRLKLTELPILDNYKINSLVLEAEELRSLLFKVNLLFGVFPYFDLGSNQDGKIEITMDHTINLFGSDQRAKVALIDIVYEGVGGANIPVATPVFVNSINSNLKKSQNHVIIPAIVVSLVITWLENA